MYVIEANDPYTRRSEYFAGIEPVGLRKAIWTKDPHEAIRFGDQASADRLNDEAVMGRAAKVAPFTS